MTNHRRGPRPANHHAPRAAHRRGSGLDLVLRPLRREPVVGQALLAFLVVAVLAHLMPWVTITGTINAETVIGFGSISGVFSALFIIVGIVLAIWWIFVPTQLARFLIGAVAACALVSVAIELSTFQDARRGALPPVEGQASARKDPDVGLPIALVATAAVIVLAGVRLWQQLRSERPLEEDPAEEAAAGSNDAGSPA